MKLFLEYSANDDSLGLLSLGCFEGIKIDPVQVIKASKNLKAILKEISSQYEMQIFVDIMSLDSSQIVAEAKSLVKNTDGVFVNIPGTKDGLIACGALSKDGILVNITNCSSISIAFLAYKFGASYVTMDSSVEKTDQSLAGDIKISFNNYPECQTEILLGNVSSNASILYGFKNQLDGCFVNTSMIKETIDKKDVIAFADARYKEYKSLVKDSGNLYS